MNAAPAEAAKKTNIFYDGTVTGKGFEGWRCMLAKTKKSVRGTIFDPDSLKTGPLVGFRLRGSVGRNNTLEMNFFALDDLEFATPLGSCNGKATTKSLTADFDLDELSGKIDSQAVKLSAKRMKKFKGTLDSDVLDPSNGEIQATFQTVVSPNGTFTVSQIETEVDLPVAIPNQITGRWGVTANDELWVVTLITPAVVQRLRGMGENGSELPQPSEVNKAEILGGPDSIQGLDCSASCFLIQCLCGFLSR